MKADTKSQCWFVGYLVRAAGKHKPAPFYLRLAAEHAGMIALLYRIDGFRKVANRLTARADQIEAEKQKGFWWNE